MQNMVPFELNRPSPAVVARIAMVLAAMAVTPIALLIINQSSLHFAAAPRVMIWLNLSTALLSAGVAAVATRTRSLRGVLLTCLLLAPIAGALNCGLTLSMAAVAHGQFQDAISLGLLGSMFGLVYGAPLGFALGTAFLLPTTVTFKLRKAASHDATELALLLCGLWLLCCSAVVLLIAGTKPTSVVAMAALGIGTLSALIAGGRLLRRHRWLQRVRRGNVPGWLLAPREDHPDHPELRTFRYQRSPGDEPEVLLRHQPKPAAYRDRNTTPVALI